MMRMFRLVGIITLLLAAGLSAPTYAIGTSLPPAILPDSPLYISAYFMTDGTPQYFEIYNTSDQAIRAANWSIGLSWNLKSDFSGPVATDFSLPLTTGEQYIPPHQYAVVSFGDAVTGASISVDPLMGEANNFISDIRLTSPGFNNFEKTFTTPQSARMQLNQTTTGYTSTGTYHADIRPSLYDNGLYQVGVSSPASFPFGPDEILANPRSCSPTEITTDCQEYVKFYNDSSSSVSFDGTRLRIGYAGQSPTATNAIALSGTLAPGKYALFDVTASGSPISITNSGGYVWLEDEYGVQTYANTVTEYPDASSTTHKGQSWALFSNGWQWAVPSPGGANTLLPVETSTTNPSQVACSANQFRNPATGRCKLIASTATPAACATNQFRNPETGRCKLVSSSSSSLQVCAANQERNPATNRCRLIASTASSLKPCAANQERNPDTNRCRNVQSAVMPSADFAVEPTAPSSQTTLGWVAFAGVGALAFGYAGWEWRREITSGLRKLLRK